MSIAGEIATEGTIRQMVEHIALRIGATRSIREQMALREVGRYALTLFEWDTPKWAAKYEKMFSEEAR